MVWDFWFRNNTENIKPRNEINQLIRDVPQTIRNNKKKINGWSFWYSIYWEICWKMSEQSKQYNAQSWVDFLVFYFLGEMGGFFGILFIGSYVGKGVNSANNIMHRAGPNF